MSETNENLVVTAETVEAVITRIGQRKDLENKLNEKNSAVKRYTEDLAVAEKVSGVESQQYISTKANLDGVTAEAHEIEEQVNALRYKQSELKPVVDYLSKEFENSLKSEQEKEYSVEIGSKKVFSQLLDYLYKDIKWTATTAVGLMMCVRNMEENKPWVHDKEFDNIIKLRSGNILVLYKSILENLEGHGFYEARTFLEVWSNAGKSLSEAVREINKEHEASRDMATKLNTIEDEFDHSEKDIEEAAPEMTTQEEVAPVAE